MNKISVTYTVTTAEQIITHAEYDLIVCVYRKGLAPYAVKFIRSQYGLDLLEAKRICDAVVAKGERGV